MHLGVCVALVVDLADVDVGDGLALCHGELSPLLRTPSMTKGEDARLDDH
jgi:hypothetical protein